MKRLFVLVGLAAVLVGTGACGGPTTGQPTPVTTGDTAGSTTTSGGSVDTSTTGGGGGGLPVDQPCSLLSSDNLSQIGVSSPPTADMVGTAHDCSMDTADYSIGVALRTNTGLDGFQVPGGTPQDKTIGSHSAKQESVSGASSCVVAIGVSSSSRVDVTATGSGSSDPCPIALTVATLIEPKLP